MDFDNTYAMLEGWCITNGTNDTDDKYRLTKFDEMNAFDKDEEVWNHVYSLSKQGSFYHQLAIKYLEVECPEEYNRIVSNKG